MLVMLTSILENMEISRMFDCMILRKQYKGDGGFSVIVHQISHANTEPFTA